MPKQRPPDHIRLDTTIPPDVNEKLTALAQKIGTTVRDLNRNVLAAISECQDIPTYYEMLHDLSKKKNP